ncbi:sugar transferase [Lactobacillus equicursoris]|uniref:Sugar transferase n=1 Tax=Lactobacillus equicursoris TaxID=420645 RepID=A0A844FM39_9LACO|nr:sugar transferase [Lactobacillus equicursoris]MST79634.1 sugar transferase [Lactobacillus equicursoris]
MEKINYRKVRGNPVYRASSRLLDLGLSSLGLILFSPLFLYLAVKIKLEDGGPIFYSQTRLGQGGRTFKIWKFRSMIEGGDQLKQELMDKNEIAGAMFKIKDDPRVTKIGKMMRRRSLDELPQLVNVLRGEMTLIGPRPPLPEEARQYSAYDWQRLLVKPGCSGLWQVECRNDGDFDQMVQLDIKYINQRSLWLDLQLMVKTIGLIFRPTGM